ncbi:MAG: pentapeptide repeat-containing protein, partial [Spirulinaceae cyanobacterium]
HPHLKSINRQNSTLIDAPNLKNINCRNSTLIDVNFRGCNLEQANFENAYINGHFSGSKLDRANFRKACFAGVCFDETNIPQANFSNATFIAAKSDKHHPNRNSFAGACLNDSDLQQITFETHVNFANSELQRTNLKGIDFSVKEGSTHGFVSFYAANLKDALMPENWIEQIPKHKIHLATLPDGTFYKYEESDWHKVPFLRNLPLPLQKLISLALWLVLLGLSILLLKGILDLAYQVGIWSFGFAPVLMTILATIVYRGFQSKPKTAYNSWDFSFLVFGFPIALLLLEIPFILIGLSINNIPLLASIFYSLIGIPIAFIFLGFLKEIFR